MKKFIPILIFFLTFTACSKNIVKENSIKEKRQDLEMITKYEDAQLALENGDPYVAAKKFLEAELLYPQSEWAPKASLLASYSYYLQNFYVEALANLERFVKVYPTDINVPYAHYLMAMCYYETIEDEARDFAPLIKAKKKFLFIIQNFPDTDYAIDAKFKLDLIEDIIAAKEMYVGRHYMKKSKWISAINRFKNVIDQYDQTIYVEEALHRLVEVYYKIGLIEESQKYANILGYNYQSSEWYKKSYRIFNKNYYSKHLKLEKNKNNEILKKIKNFF